MTKVEMLEIVHQARAIMVNQGHLVGAYGRLADGRYADDIHDAATVSLKGAFMLIKGYAWTQRTYEPLVKLMGANNPHGVWTDNMSLPGGATFDMLFDTLRRVEKAIHDQG